MGFECFDVVGLAPSPYWHVSAIVLLADVLFQDTGVDVCWLQRTGNIMTCHEGRVGNMEGEWGVRRGWESIWGLAKGIFQQFHMVPQQPCFNTSCCGHHSLEVWIQSYHKNTICWKQRSIYFMEWHHLKHVIKMLLKEEIWLAKSKFKD